MGRRPYWLLMSTKVLGPKGNATGIPEAAARELDELLTTLVEAIGAGDEERICCHDITLSDYRALRVVQARGLPAIQDVVDALGVSKSGATRIVDRLERKGYVRRERGQHDDGRFCCLRLTPGGERLLQRIDAETLPRRQALLASIDPARRASVLEGLRLLGSAIRQIERS